MEEFCFKDEMEIGEKATETCTTDDVYFMMSINLNKIKEVIELPANTIRRLLHEYKWDPERLLEAIFENEKLTENNWEYAPRNIRTLMDCEICSETFKDPAKMRVLECNHRFCIYCVSQHLKMQISDGGLLDCISCPGFGCKYEFDDDFVLQNIDVEEATKYKRIITNSYVKSDQMIKWCPSADCTNAIKVKSGYLLDLSESVRCSCGTYFCFKCDFNESHDPLDCKMLTKWLQDMQTNFLEALSEQWVSRNTRKCPKCNTNIEKNGGCNHMTCRRCQHEFCWVCFSDFRGSHNCFKRKQSNSASSSMTIASRTMHYGQKFVAMNKAYKEDVKHYRSLMEYDKKIELDAQWVKVDFIANGIEILLQCRRTIMFTYGFLAYMTTIGNHIYLLEDMLDELYLFSEHLAYFYENENDTANIYVTKAKALDLTQSCKLQRQRLLDFIKEGKENKWWREWPIPPAELLGNPGDYDNDYIDVDSDSD